MISPEEAVRAYHAVLARLSIKPHRTLADDLLLQTAVMSYGGGSTVTVPAGMPGGGKRSDQGGPDNSIVGAPQAQSGGVRRTDNKLSVPPKKSGADATSAEKSSTAAGDRGCGCGGHKKTPEAKPAACGCSSKLAATPAGSTSNSHFPEKSVAEGPQALDGKPDFAHMSQAEKLAYNQRERDRVYG